MSEITLNYVHRRSMGYGRLGVDLAAALEAEGVTVYDHLGDHPNISTSSEVPITEGRVEKPGGHTNVVSWVSTPSHAKWWWTGQYRSIFTMWEARVLPPAFRENLHEFELIVVPSEQNVELFSEYHPNVKLNPLGVDLDRWHYRPREVGREFRFLIGGSGKRKGTDLAFKAFRTVFSGMWDEFGRWTGAGPEARLVMKNPRGEEKFQGWHGIDMISGRLSDEDEETLYASCHAYIQPSRGEGFGLQPLQAMAQGMPTILTDAHGHGSYAKYATHPVGWKWSPADYFIFGDAGEWWEPDFEQLCEAMWDVYHDYTTHLAAAEQTAKNVIPNQFTWAHCARRFVEAHDGALDAPYTGDGSYSFPVLSEFLVRVLRKHEADIAGAKHLWFPGKDYYEVADTKRVLYESNVLDPSCITGPDHGLAPQQIEKLGAYSANTEWCPTCHRRMDPADETREDVIYAQLEAAALS